MTSGSLVIKNFWAIRISSIENSKLKSYLAFTEFLKDILKKVKIICSKHGLFEQVPKDHLKGSGCPKCKLSKGIKKICDILDLNNIKYEREVIIDGCKSKNNIHLRFDLYLSELNTYIEYDGEQHFRQVSNWGGTSSFLKNIERDNIKNEFCKLNNINLFRISYKEDVSERVNVILKLYSSLTEPLPNL